MTTEPDARLPRPPPVTSLYVWGNERADVNHAARLLAQRLDPQHVWLEAHPGSTGATPTALPGADGSTRVDPPESLVPAAPISEVLLWTFLKPQGQRHFGRELRDYLQLPGPVQEAVARLKARSGPRVLAVANVDLLEGFDSARRGLYGQFVEYLNAQEITLIVASTSRPQIERIDFEYSVTLTSSLPGPVQPGSPVCQWGDCSSCVVKWYFRSEEVACIGALRAQPPRAAPESFALTGFAAH